MSGNLAKIAEGFFHVYRSGLKQADGGRQKAADRGDLTPASFRLSPRCLAFLRVLGSLSAESQAALIERGVRGLVWYELLTGDEHFGAMFDRLMAKDFGAAWAADEEYDVVDLEKRGPRLGEHERWRVGVVVGPGDTPAAAPEADEARAEVPTAKPKAGGKPRVRKPKGKAK